MKSKALLFTLFSLSALISCTSQEEVNVNQSVVKQFYDNLSIILNNPDSDEAYIAKEDCIDMCKVSDLSMNFPNEFKWMGIIDREEDNISIISYVTLLRKLAKKTHAKLDFSIENFYPYIDEQKDSSNVYQYFLLRKEYSMPEYKCAFVDTVLVSPDTLIIGIKNIAGGHAFTKYELTLTEQDVLTKE